MAKVKRIFMTVRRGITDSTLLCVFPWEKPILEEIHGDKVNLISIEDMCSMEGVKSVKKIKIVHSNDLGLTLRQQYEAMCEVDEDDNPLQDADSEYGRMAEKYGMHVTLDMPNVEKVYGSVRNFKMVLRDFAQGKTPAFLEDVDINDDDASEIAIADMTIPQLRERLNKVGIKYSPKANREQLQELLVEADSIAA